MMSRDALVGRIADILSRTNTPGAEELVQRLIANLPEKLTTNGPPVPVMTKFHADLLHKLSEPVARSGVSDSDELIRVLQLNLLALKPEEKISRFRSLAAAGSYPYIESLALERDLFDVGGLTMRLRLSRRDQRDAPKLEVIFEGVVDLKLDDLNGIPVVVLGITSVRERQLEDITFRVEELGGDAIFSFLCADFSWRVLDAGEVG